MASKVLHIYATLLLMNEHFILTLSFAKIGLQKITCIQNKLYLYLGINAFHFIQTLTIGAVHILGESKAAYNVCTLVYQTTNVQRNQISDLQKVLKILETGMDVRRSDIRAKKVCIDLDVGLREAAVSVGLK